MPSQVEENLIERNLWKVTPEKPPKHVEGSGKPIRQYLPERRYNATAIMASSRYALVGYVRNTIGEFIERVRRELHPDLPLLAAHVTILPPRILCGSEGDALESLHDICSRTEPFEVTLGEVETFIPVTPTVFIRVGHGASRMQELHEQLNREVF